jgi:DNA-binding response OmpR family regulator
LGYTVVEQRYVLKRKARGMTEKKKILIADDDESIHDLLTEALRTEDYEIIHAYDGQETLERAVEELPDLVVLDTMMPMRDGRDICKELKSNPETVHMKIVMLSAKADQQDRILGFELGADDYITKPSSIHYITRTVTNLLEKQG